MNPLITMRRASQRPIECRLRSKMKIIPSTLLLAVAMLLGPSFRLIAADDDGVALAILYDTSGSMKDTVPSKSGAPQAKYAIANRALLAVVEQIQMFVTNNPSGAPRKVQAGLFTFEHDGAKEVVKLGPFDPAAIQNWATNFNSPKGNTPLGNALNTAAQSVLDSPMPRKHVLVITD